MKRSLLFFLTFITSYTSFSQEPSDLLRYSWTTINGTARQQAIGGAMGSLGGDITAAYVNPAGLAFFKNNDAAFSFRYLAGKNKGKFLGEEKTKNDGKFDVGSMGFVFANRVSKDEHKSIALGLALNTTGSFKQRLNYSGVNYTSSYSQKFLEEIRNNNVKDANILGSEFSFGSSLAFNTYWIDSVAGGSAGNYDFQSRSKKLLPTGLIQEQQLLNKGGIYEPSIALAAQTNEQWLLGGSLSFPYLHYRRISNFTEADNTDDSTNKFNFATFNEDLTTSGWGINMKFGVIYKPQEYWRLGLAFHTPSLYNVTDEFEYSVTTDTENYQGIWSDYSKDYTGGELATMKYRMITPYRVVGSISYVLRETEDITKQRGFITADAEFVNYKAASLHPELDDEVITDEATKKYLKAVNKSVNDLFKPAFNFRVGAELKFTYVMMRAGAAYYGNPYKETYGGKGSKLNLTGGLGFRAYGMFLDLAYVHSINRDIHAPYRLQYDNYPVAKVRSTVGNYILTVGFKL